MKWLRWMTVGYWAALSVLLLVPDPWALLGFPRPLGVGSGFGTHLVTFLILGTLVGWCRWPGGPRTRAAVLIGYALVVEWAQAMVPRRTVQWEDLVENLTGLALGTLLCWAVRHYVGRASRQGG